MTFAVMRPSISSPILGMVRYRFPSVADLYDPPHHVATRRGDGDKDLIELDRQLLDVVDDTQDGHAVDRLALCGGRRRGPHGAVLDARLSRISRSIFSAASPAPTMSSRVRFAVRVEKGEEDGVEKTRRDSPLDVNPDEQADPADQHHGEQGIQDEDASRESLVVTNEQKASEMAPAAITAALMMLMRSAILV